MSGEEKDLFQIIREEVIKEVMVRGGGQPGSDLHEVKLSIMEIKDVLYSKLMEIEIDQVKEKWGG